MNKIIYGGAFNPPTIAHYQVCKYLLDKFNDCKLILMPSNSYYKNGEMASFEDRVNMLNIMANLINITYPDRINVSELEKNDPEFMGTYYTLKKLNHPYFVIGADSLNKLETWINGIELIKENKFIVFPRGEYNIDEILNRPNYRDYVNHFIILSDFPKVNVSSTLYRSGDKSVTLDEINDYIKKNNLYM